MPRKKIPFKILPGSRIRYIDDFGQPLFVATDIARAMGYPPKKAGATTNTWKVQVVQLMAGHKDWRMMTLEDVRHACYRCRAKENADGFRMWLESTLRWLGYSVVRLAPNSTL